MYQQDPHADRQQTQFMLDKIQELQASVDRLIRHQDGNYLASTENFCLGFVGIDMARTGKQVDFGNNRGWAWLVERRGTYFEGTTQPTKSRLERPGTRIHFYNRLQRPLFAGEPWAFFKDRLGQWNQAWPMGWVEGGSYSKPYFREPNFIGKTISYPVAAASRDADGTVNVGSGIAVQMYYDHNTGTLEFEDVDAATINSTIQVHNTTSSPIEEGKIITAKLISNKYFIDSVPCDEL